MLRDLSRALDHLTEPELRGVVARCLALAVLLFLGLATALYVLLGAFAATGYLWLNEVIEWAGVILALGLAWFAFPAAVIVFLGLFLDEVAGKVERRFYPDLPPATPPGAARSLLAGLRFAGLALLLNLAALPLYLLIPGANLVLFLLLNGHLLGREYFEQVAQRRLAPRAAADLRRRHAASAFASGLVIAGLSAVPFLNLVAPVAATVFMVHRVRRLPDSLPSPRLPPVVRPALADARPRR